MKIIGYYRTATATLKKFTLIGWVLSTIMTAFLVYLCVKIIRTHNHSVAVSDELLFERQLVAISDTIASEIVKSGKSSIFISAITDLSQLNFPIDRLIADELSINLARMRGRRNYAILIERRSTQIAEKDSVAEAMIAGSVTDMGGYLRLTTKLIEDETGRIIGGASCNLPKPEIFWAVSKDPRTSTISEKRSLLFDYIKTRVQTTNDDAQAILIYGTIALAVIVLLLPIYLVRRAKSVYWIALTIGTILLAGGSFSIVSYSRQQIAWSERKFGTFFEHVIMKCDQDSSVLSMISQFNKRYPPHYKDKGWVFKLGQYAVIVGGLLYIILFIYGMRYSIVSNQSFFVK